MTTCRHFHCPGHEIEHCPVILAALVQGSERACRVCGCETESKRHICIDCYASMRREPGCAAAHRLELGRPKTYTIVWAPPGCDFRPGAELVHFEAAVSAGLIDTGMLVRTVARRDGRSRSLYYWVGNGQLNQTAGPAEYFRRHPLAGRTK